MAQKFDPRQKDQLLSEERQKLLQPAKLLRSLGLRAGDTLADIGCGPGFFTLPAAEIVGPRGLVYAADIQGDMLSAVKTRANEANLTNVQVIKSSDTQVPIRAASVDMALLAFTLHEIDQRARFLHRVSRLLKPSGKLIIIEWEKQSDAPGPPANARLTAEDAIKDAEAAGLVLAEQRNLNVFHYLCVLTPAAH
ncbi:MAG TPA: methyltransferase domain-containing protein [Ktedonobacterales bacterium]|nr:methyltransferase domain-containing protein [Ktedonobacterales bacterium]